MTTNPDLRKNPENAANPRVKTSPTSAIGDVRKEAEKAVLYKSAGYSLNRLSALYGESPAIVSRGLREQGVAIRGPGEKPCGESVEVTMARLYALHLSIARIGFLTGYKKHRTRQKLEAVGIEIRHRGPQLRVEVDVEKMARLYFEDRWSIESVAESAKVSSWTARKLLLDHGVKIRPRGVPAGYSRPKLRVIPAPRAMPLKPETAIALTRLGLTSAEIIQATDRSSVYVYTRTAEAGRVIRTRPDVLGVSADSIAAVYRVTGSAAVTGQVFHISETTVPNRIREVGESVQPRGGARIFNPDATPVHIAETQSWELRDPEILDRRARNQSIAQIAMALGASPHEVNDVLRVYQPRDQAALISRRRAHGESVALIAVRIAMRPDRVRAILAERTVSDIPSRSSMPSRQET